METVKGISRGNVIFFGVVVEVRGSWIKLWVIFLVPMVSVGMRSLLMLALSSTLSAVNHLSLGM